MGNEKRKKSALDGWSLLKVRIAALEEKSSSIGIRI
jgi:hypothetical protein